MQNEKYNSDIKLAIHIFELVRDIRYNIPLKNSDFGLACHGKSMLLFDLLKAYGFNVRFMACEFEWKKIPIKDDLKKLARKKKSIHTFVSIFLNNKWQILDSTFDYELSSKLPINMWDGKTGTKIQVRPYKMKSQKFANEYLKKIRNTERDIKEHMINKKLFVKLNSGYKKIRNMH